MKLLLAVAAALSLPAFLHADTLSINFVDAFGVDDMLSSDVAGLAGSDTRVGNWNNVQAAVSGSNIGGFKLNTGANFGASLSFNTDLGTWRLPEASGGTGDDKMWKGYLDAAANASLTLSGVSFVGAYDVYVYFDGENGAAWRVANFTINGVSASGEDTEGTNWGIANNAGKFYQLPVAGGPGNLTWPVAGGNNNEGNYVKFSGVTGDTFTMNFGGIAQSDIQRAPINGIQVVGVPEPASMGLLLGGAAMLFGRRRRR